MNKVVYEPKVPRNTLSPFFSGGGVGLPRAVPYIHIRYMILV